MPDTTKETDAGTKLIEQFEFPEDDASLPKEAKPNETATKAPAEDQPKLPEHPRWLINAAKRAKISAEEMATMSTDDLKEAISLAPAVETHNNVATDVNKVLARDPATGQFVSPTQQPADQQQIPQQQVQRPQPKDITLESLGIDAGKWDETTPASEIALQIVKAVINHVQPEAIRSKLDAMEGEFRNRAMNETFDKLDQLFVTKKGIFGDQSRFEMDQTSPEFLRRQAVIDAMGKMRAASPSLPMRACFDKVTSAMFGNLIPRSEPKPDPEIAEYAAGVTNQPAIRATKPAPKGTKAAEETVRKFLADREYRSDEPSEYDELPD